MSTTTWRQSPILAVSTPQYFGEADFPPLSTSASEPAASAEAALSDHELALRLQRQFDLEEHQESFDPGIHYEEEEYEEEAEERTRDADEENAKSKEESVAAAAVEVSEGGHEENDLDADLAFALSLQSRFEEEALLEAQQRRYTSPYEKVTSVSLPKAYGSYEDSLLYSNTEDSQYDDQEDEEEDSDFEAEYNERFNNPHAPTLCKPHHTVVKTQGRRPSGAVAAERRPLPEIITKHDPIIAGINNAQKIERYIDSGDMRSMKVGTTAYNALKKDTARGEVERMRKRGNKKDESHHESVMDQPTRMILYKMINSGLLDELNGVVSTGKESHVFHAVAGSFEFVLRSFSSHFFSSPLFTIALSCHLNDFSFSEIEDLKKGEELAVKIFNMDMNQKFKDRTKYVDGERRYRHVPTQNSRKAIKVWAEKELRNLNRLQHGGILSPRPILLRNNVLLMSFVGKGGVAAPRLKDAKLSMDKLHEAYMQCILMMRKMYQECNLVHADLSEYNILYHRHKLWFIDVSQAIEKDHENAFDFLRRDCSVITKFFRKNGVRTAMTTRELFDFITDESITAENIDDYLEKMQEKIVARLESGQEPTYEEELESAVFDKIFIPRRLSEVKHPAREIDETKMGSSPLVHSAVTGLRSDLSGINDTPELLYRAELERRTEEESDGDDDGDEEESEDDEGEELDE
ncbi:Serine/threonine-protein kinase RIO1 [Balamuthia mandrillaris]